ncbi:hypothetical protein CAC42_4310 [Sphaceloma murrayae]|uniref:RRM domain-containing protein n=1 Tax=Sphaceloma murrayae TaxID=2082308 RepID=A0A2K1QL20_9PEZI|nr:hypothetical protein CAC42_4310 [Sphaceloma murrayae]
MSVYLLRRAAARGLQTKSFAFQQSSRSFISSSALVSRTQPQLRHQWQQTRRYSDEAEKKNESPAEQQSGETVTSEPSAETQKQEIVEESIATSEVTDGAHASATESSDANPMGMEPGDAAPEPQTTSAPASNTISSTLDSAKDVFGSAARTANRVASNAASSVTGSSGRGFGRDRENPHQPEATKILYVGNLFFDLTVERLKAAFSPIGNVVNCKIVTDTSGLSKGFGYVEFESVEEAARAIEELDQQELEGRRMAVQYHVRRTRTTERRGSSNPPSKTLFIGNMSFQMSDKDLNDLFRQVKNVLDVRVAIDRRSGQPRGFAHADFTDTASAEKAKSVLANKVVYGRQLRVDFGLPSVSPKQQ